MFGSSAFDHVDDPTDPAWSGHSLGETVPWWRRRAVLVGAGAVIVAMLIGASWMVVRGNGGDADATASGRRAAATGTRAAETSVAGVDVVNPTIDAVDPNVAKDLAANFDRPLPDVSTAVRPDVARDDAPLTGPTGDVGLTARVEHSDLPSLYINDGSGAAGASFDGWGATANLFGDLQGLDTLLRIRLDQLGVAMGVRLEVVSGFRTHEEQQALYAKYLSGTGNLAAIPGTSRHETGRAADIYVDGVALANVPGARDAAAKLGLGFPVAGEAWHTEIVNSTG